MNQELELKIIRYLQEHSVCTLATIEDNRPLASAMEFVNEGATLYLAAIADTRKVANLRANPAVSLTVNEAYVEGQGVRGLQIFGTARPITDPAERDRVRSLFSDKFTVYQMIHWKEKRTVYYEITPDRIDYIDYSQEYGHKDTWLPPVG